ncbi:MAG: SUF system Fe-S cluster assembly regulator [Legionellales bacterium]|nr:SUF system Fe-S cluster assembly regulator [Legionellales bacterium]
MLRISKLADYGTVVMVYLARRAQHWLTASDIAEQTHVPQPTVSKLLKQLHQAQLVDSKRGSEGGYRLAYPADKISVADIIQAIDGETAVTQCSDSHEHCVLQPVCQIKGNWRLINHAITAALASVTLAAFAKPAMKIDRIDISEIRQIGVRHDTTDA